MKATFEFDMSDPDDIMAHLRHTKSLDMASALWHILFNTKKGFEWDIEAGKFETQYDLLEAIYTAMHEEMGDHNINIEELIN